MTERRGFEPARYLTRVNGSDYLEVKWRLVWLRDAHPDAVLETECLESSETHSRFKATITTPSGARATGHGSETAGDFRDHYEKSETKAIGRALAALGYGTQFAPDHDFGVDQGRVVDAPVQRPRNPSNGAAPRTAPESRPQRGDPNLASIAQRNALFALFPKAGHTEADFRRELWEMFNLESTKALTKAQASQMIDMYQQALSPPPNGPALPNMDVPATVSDEERAARYRD